MKEDENAWLQKLQAHDKVHIYSSLYKEGYPPVDLGIVAEVDTRLIVVQPASKKGTLFFRATDGYTDGLYIKPYSDEQELVMRAEKEKSALASKLNRVDWRKLPVDVLDDICAILRENGAIQ